jgi:low temperature requirement protein LtrA
MKRLYNISSGLAFGMMWVLAVLFLRDGQEEKEMDEWIVLATGFFGLFMAISMSVVFEKLQKVKVKNNRNYLRHK